MQEAFPTQLLLKTPRGFEKRGKYSADLSTYKPRNRSQRIKERSVETRQNPEEISSPTHTKCRNIVDTTFKNK